MMKQWFTRARTKVPATPFFTWYLRFIFVCAKKTVKPLRETYGPEVLFYVHKENPSSQVHPHMRGGNIFSFHPSVHPRARGGSRMNPFSPFYARGSSSRAKKIRASYAKVHPRVRGNPSVHPRVRGKNSVCTM
jgi:hypothetical protein